MLIVYFYVGKIKNLSEGMCHKSRVLKYIYIVHNIKFYV